MCVISLPSCLCYWYEGVAEIVYLRILRQLCPQTECVAPIAQGPAVFGVLLHYRKELLARSDERSLGFSCSSSDGSAPITS